jgi:HTH-type transcriptional regulator/antitoxin HigA
MNRKIYGELLSQTIPVVITNQKEFDRLEDVSIKLLGKQRSPEEDKLFDLIVALLEDYEEKTLPALEPREPRETLRFLMDENGLKQADLNDVFGSQSVVSEILSGKRNINLGQARKLAERFGVSAGLFV